MRDQDPLVLPTTPFPYQPSIVAQPLRSPFFSALASPRSCEHWAVPGKEISSPSEIPEKAGLSHELLEQFTGTKGAEAGSGACPQPAAAMPK